MPPCVSAWKIRPGTPNGKATACCSGAKSRRWRCQFSGERLRSVDGGAEHLLVSWLGKEAMAGVGLADSFNMVIIAFSPRWISAPPWWWPSASASAIVGARARRVSPGLDDRRGAAVGGRHSSGGRIDHRCDRRGGLAGGEGAGAFLPADHGVELSGGGDCADWQRRCAARATPRSRC